MPSGLEIIQKAMQDFIRVQKSMIAAREEKAVKTYEILKEEYIYLKALLAVAGVNLTAIDMINE